MMLNGTIDLGKDLEAIRSFAHFGRLSPGKEHGMLHGALHAALEESEDIPQDDLDAVARDASSFLQKFRAELTDNDIFILEQLSGAAQKSKL